MSGSDRRDPPIEEQAFLSGVTVVDIGDMRVARGLSRRPHAICPHRRLVYDKTERRIWCRDCETDVDGFDAFSRLVDHYDGAMKQLAERLRQVGEMESFQARSRAARALDEIWRRRKFVPACPHCRKGLLPEHFKDGCRKVRATVASGSREVK